MMKAKTTKGVARAVTLLLTLGGLSGCAALSSLDSASKALPTYELQPVPQPSGTGAATSRTLLLAPPTATAALNTDRVMIRPSTLLIEYLPDARWTDVAPVHVQDLLMRSISNTGALAHVGADAAGPLPDFVLLTEVQAFQAEVTPAGSSPPAQVRVRLRLTMVRDSDRRIVGSRTFEQSVGSNGLDSPTLMLAFDAAMGAALRDATAWIVGMTGGRVS